MAACRPELKRLLPSMIQSSPSRTAAVSSQVASEPWSGSVRPKPIFTAPVIMPSMNCSFWEGVPKRCIMITVGKLPTIEDSFCRSLCRPRPLAARCSRITAIARFEPS